MVTIERCRKFFAEYVVHIAGSADARLIDAFAAVARERFVGPGPWDVCVGQGYLRTPDADPRWIYQDVVVALDREAGLNNGQPTLHARCLDEAQIEPGQTVVHVGAGSGYYTAMLAQLVGPRGKVVAFEINEALARRAQANLAAFAQVELRAASAVDAPLPRCDAIYVCAGVTDPPATWLDALRVGGRLVLPLTTGAGHGVMLAVTRGAGERYAARALLPVGFVGCVGAHNEATSRSLAAALQRDSIERIRSLRRDDAADASAWCRGAGWWLSCAESG